MVTQNKKQKLHMKSENAVIRTRERVCEHCPKLSTSVPEAHKIETR